MADGGSLLCVWSFCCSCLLPCFTLFSFISHRLLPNCWLKLLIEQDPVNQNYVSEGYFRCFFYLDPIFHVLVLWFLVVCPCPSIRRIIVNTMSPWGDFFKFGTKHPLGLKHELIKSGGQRSVWPPKKQKTGRNSRLNMVVTTRFYTNVW